MLMNFVFVKVLFTIIIMWILCTILTALNAFDLGSPARTDTKLSILINAPWFQLPYPGGLFHSKNYNCSKILSSIQYSFRN